MQKIGMETTFDMEITKIMIPKGCGGDVVKILK